MSDDYLEIQSENFGSLFIKIQKETECYYFINQYPNISLVPIKGILRATKAKHFLQLDKTKNYYSDAGFRIIGKANAIPSKINRFRIYD